MNYYFSHWHLFISYLICDHLHVVWSFSLSGGGTHENHQRLWDQVGLADKRKHTRWLQVIHRLTPSLQGTSPNPTDHVVTVQRQHSNLQPLPLCLSDDPLSRVLGGSGLTPVQDQETGPPHCDCFSKATEEKSCVPNTQCCVSSEWTITTLHHYFM